MAFQTNILRDGTWITENVNMQAFLSTQGQSRAENKKRTSPVCGLLTRTVVESPVVQWIFPVRLRSADHNDVAFIGDRFVQIKELRGDGKLHDVARKSDFRSRIINARVLGSFYEDSLADGEFRVGDRGTGGSRLSRRSYLHSPTENEAQLPPQLLVLVLENGQIVFLFLHQADRGACSFVSSVVESPRQNLAVHPGYHFAIDPSSKYMVTATSEGLFVVYELDSLHNLRRQYQTPGTLMNPVVAYRPRTVTGVIHKVDFLYPGTWDDNTIILILLIVRNGVSRMITYEWVQGDDLNSVFSVEMAGFRLPPDHRMPLLLIPLTVKTSFLSVSENSIAVFRDVLHGSSNPELVNTTTREKTVYHHGSGRPLWTAWTRPLRRKAFYQSKDNIYLAREDGIIFYFEIDSDEILESSLDVGDYSTNISTAFATVADTFSDILILGGSCGDGSIWALPARERPEQIGIIPNWSPVLDFATTDQFTSWNQVVDNNGSRIMPWRTLPHAACTQHDRLFVTSGCGINGSLTELVHGTIAHVTLEVDYGSPLRRVWAFANSNNGESNGFIVLLSLHTRSIIAEITPDLSDVREPEPSSSWFDTSSRTLAASQLHDLRICQVSETSITIIESAKRSCFLINDILHNPNARAENACIKDEIIAFSAIAETPNSGFEIHLVATSDPTKVLRRYTIQQEVTCLQLCTINGVDFLMAAVWRPARTCLQFYCIDSSDSVPLLNLELNPGQTLGFSEPSASGYNEVSPVEAVTHLVLVFERGEKSIIVGGTRGGYFLVVEIESAVPIRVTHRLERFGTLPIDILPSHGSYADASGQPVFVCYGASVALLDDYDVTNGAGFKTRARLIPVDSDCSALESPLVTSVARLPVITPDYHPLLMVTGSRLLITRLESHPEIIPRPIPLGGTPSRVIYSHLLECLIVAVNVGDRPTLMFLDSDTGRNLSWPTDRNKEDQEFISGLGHQGDWVHCLDEWLFQKEDKTFSFILVTTHSGRLLIVSAEKIDGRVRFWTRHKKNSPGPPIYSVTAVADNIFFCVGTTIYWEILDVVERKIREHAKIELVSPATSMSILAGKLYALTQAHSLEIVDLDRVEESRDNYTIGDGLMEKRMRPTMHMIHVGDATDTPGPWPITLLSDRECGVIGVWAPLSREEGGISVVFEAELPASVRRFRRGHTRPAWWRSKFTGPRYGRLMSTADDADILGVCLDGSVHSFTLLTLEAWRFLKLVQNAAVSQFNAEDRGLGGQRDEDFEPMVVPKLQLQVDGDILYWCWRGRELEGLFKDRDERLLFMRYLDELDGGEWTRGFKQPGETPVIQGGQSKNEAEGNDAEGCDAAASSLADANIGHDKHHMHPGDGYDSRLLDGAIGKYMELGYQILDYYLSPII
ncbi:hypothetical protein jhhlp_003472 [Lomentospora prolificans]|uniref:Uncharacterized protein n=1 Tax=Lomentospora prolificans TaxID=41688 RepID=A0A2N3N8U6_9PEZI|nr:hypothetical protein jhhlp_003472 [Lomentospora prolificans]